MSWWDYGYQITAMANRTILVDNNTWNNTHISRVGQAMASPEEESYEIMRELDVDYVLVIFGGMIGYSSDGKNYLINLIYYFEFLLLEIFIDINKFLWMVRIGGSTEKGKHIKDEDYYTPQGEFRVDKEGSPKLLNCLMYKLSYYKFGQMYTDHGNYFLHHLFGFNKIVIYYYIIYLDKPPGYDRVRNTEIGNKNFELSKLEEAYTTEHWMVRIYKVKKPENRGQA